MNKICAFILTFLLFSGCGVIRSKQPYKKGFFGGVERSTKAKGKEGGFFTRIFKKNRSRPKKVLPPPGGQDKKNSPVAKKIAEAAKDLPKPADQGLPPLPLSPVAPAPPTPTPKTQGPLNANRLIGHLTGRPSGKESHLTETVDVFAPPHSGRPLEVQEELDIYQEAELLHQQNRPIQALEKLKLIENSPVRQIQVHARFLMGEIMFQQEQYALAVQNYEEILSKYAFSGLVIRSLERLVICGQKLNDENLTAKYHSLLYNSFGR